MTRKVFCGLFSQVQQMKKYTNNFLRQYIERQILPKCKIENRFAFTVSEENTYILICFKWQFYIFGELHKKKLYNLNFRLLVEGQKAKKKGMDSVKSSYYYSGRRVSPFLTDTFGNDDSCNNTDHVQKWLNLANRIYGGYTRKELCAFLLLYCTASVFT